MPHPDARPDDATLPEHYDYHLPEALIAHQPAAERDASRLLVCDHPDAAPGQIVRFAQLDAHVRPGDLLVFNDTRVVPCRLYARKPTGGRVEVFVLGPADPAATAEALWQAPASPDDGVTFRAMMRSNKPLRAGLRVTLDAPDGHRASAELVARGDDQMWTLRYHGDLPLGALLDRAGEMPLPPYIVRRRKALGEDPAQRDDPTRYQTVYARARGSVAAPTAGLHFTPDLFERLDALGVERAFLTLHVGLGTFKPLDPDTPIQDQHLHTERYRIPPALAEAIARCRARGGRVIAVGTTSARALEDQGRRWEAPKAVAGDYTTDIFIRPGHRWRLVDGLITNFHLPKSSLLVLVSTLFGRAPTLALYREAVAQKMRFYSYGDAMFLTRPDRG